MTLDVDGNTYSACPYEQPHSAMIAQYRDDCKKDASFFFLNNAHKLAFDWFLVTSYRTLVYISHYGGFLLSTKRIGILVKAVNNKQKKISQRKKF